MKKTLLYISLCMALTSCSWFSEEIPLTIHDQVVIDAAHKRAGEYRNRKTRQCKEVLLNKAIEHVDSIITNYQDKINQDTTFFPSKPSRPIFPSKLLLDSTLIPKPIIIIEKPINSEVDTSKQVKSF